MFPSLNLLSQALALLALCMGVAGLVGLAWLAHKQASRKPAACPKCGAQVTDLYGERVFVVILQSGHNGKVYLCRSEIERGALLGRLAAGHGKHLIGDLHWFEGTLQAPESAEQGASQ